jgi:hypothetical protein
MTIIIRKRNVVVVGGVVCFVGTKVVDVVSIEFLSSHCLHLVLVGLQKIVESGKLVRRGVNRFLVLDPVKKVQHPVKLFIFFKKSLKVFFFGYNSRIWLCLN